MKLKDLMEKYGEYEVDLKTVVGKSEIESVTIDLTKPKPKSVWELKEGDIYFVLYTDGDMTDYEWKRGGGVSKSYRDQGNVFLTKEEAKKEAERKEVETLLLKFGGRRWYKRFGENFGFLIDDIGYRFGIHSLNQIQGTIYFDTYSDAKKALDSIGADRIKKALFEVKNEGIY